MLRRTNTTPSYDYPSEDIDYTQIGEAAKTEADPAANDNRDPSTRRHMLDKRRRRWARLSAR